MKQFSLTTLCTLPGLLPALVPFIGCGGISSGADALEFARVEAARWINDELTELLRGRARRGARSCAGLSSSEQLTEGPVPASAEPTVEVLH